MSAWCSRPFAITRSTTGGKRVKWFSEAHCWRDVPIEVIGCFDTVKSLGLRAPFVWKWSEIRHSFHNHQLGHHIRHGYHALALDETREAFRPILWECEPGREGTVKQVWFRGSHSDIGGHAGRQHQGATALEHPAYVDAGADRAKRSAVASGLAAEVSDGSRRAFSRDLVGMGQDFSCTEEAGVRN